MPMQFFYARENLPLPDLEFIDGGEMPEPERKLLVHDFDMTPTLEDFHGSKLGLRVFQKDRSDDYLLRLVVLETTEDQRPVEFGAIGIRLEAFTDQVRELIVQGKEPLGGILQREKLGHKGKPRAFLRVWADKLVSEALGVPLGTELYGRCNQLMDADGIVFADIVEILPKSA